MQASYPQNPGTFAKRIGQYHCVNISGGQQMPRPSIRLTAFENSYKNKRESTISVINKANTEKKITIERAYFCDTPYQVFTCIHMELHDKTNSDLYILDSFSDARRLRDEVISCGLFRRVFLINAKRVLGDVNSTLQAKTSVLKSYINLDKTVQRYFDCTVLYDHIYFTCNNLFFRLPRFYYMKHGIRTKYVLYDEGVGSYDGHFERIDRADYWSRKMLFGKQATSMDIEKYLYCPELYYDFEKNKEIIHALPVFDSIDDNYRRNYKAIFDSQLGDSFKYKCVFFDGKRKEMCKHESSVLRMQEWYSQIESTIGAEKMVVKTHPRTNEKYAHKCDDYPNSKCPIEVDYYLMDMSDKVLISFASTAVVSPKLLFDEEPVVILLCCLDKRVYWPNKEQLDFYYKVRSLYKNRERFMIPTSMDEFSASLNFANQFIEGKEYVYKD